MPWELVMTKWLMCLFADVLPTETALRVWDCLFYEGSKILIRVALCVTMLAREDILKASSLQEIVTQFKDSVTTKNVTDCHDFLDVRGTFYSCALLLLSLFLQKNFYHDKSSFAQKS